MRRCLAGAARADDCGLSRERDGGNEFQDHCPAERRCARESDGQDLNSGSGEERSESLSEGRPIFRNETACAAALDDGLDLGFGAVGKEHDGQRRRVARDGVDEHLVIHARKCRVDEEQVGTIPRDRFVDGTWVVNGVHLEPGRRKSMNNYSPNQGAIIDQQDLVANSHCLNDDRRTRFPLASFPRADRDGG